MRRQGKSRYKPLTQAECQAIEEDNQVSTPIQVGNSTTTLDLLVKPLNVAINKSFDNLGIFKLRWNKIWNSETETEV